MRNLLQDLRFGERRLLQQLHHLVAFLPELPLQIEKVRLRAGHLALDRLALFVLEPEVLGMGHDQLGRTEVARERIGLRRRRLRERGERKKSSDDEEQAFHERPPVNFIDGVESRTSRPGVRSRKSVGARQVDSVASAGGRAQSMQYYTQSGGVT